MARRRGRPRGTKQMHSSNSPQANRHRNEKFPNKKTTHWLKGAFFSPVGSSLDAIRNATTEQFPDKYAREQLLRDELIKVGDYLEEYLSDSELVHPIFRLLKKTQQQCW